MQAADKRGSMRTNRLMRLMDSLRRPPAPVTAETGVSLRQLYRDIATLRAGGALIDGAAGLGYTLTEDPALPPQSFSRLEIEALRMAAESLTGIGDEDLVRAGRDALARIVAMLPERQPRQAMHAITRCFPQVPDWHPPQVDPALIQAACWDEQALLIGYTDLNGAGSQRVIWLLGPVLFRPVADAAGPLPAADGLSGLSRQPHWHSQPDGRQLSPWRVGLVRDYAQAQREHGMRAPR